MQANEAWKPGLRIWGGDPGGRAKSERKGCVLAEQSSSLCLNVNICEMGLQFLVAGPSVRAYISAFGMDPRFLSLKSHDPKPQASCGEARWPPSNSQCWKNSRANAWLPFWLASLSSRTFWWMN
jgi:hypothetical protein